MDTLRAAMVLRCGLCCDSTTARANSQTSVSEHVSVAALPTLHRCAWSARIVPGFTCGGLSSYFEPSCTISIAMAGRDSTCTARHSRPTEPGTNVGSHRRSVRQVEGETHPEKRKKCCSLAWNGPLIVHFCGYLLVTLTVACGEKLGSAKGSAAWDLSYALLGE